MKTFTMFRRGDISDTHDSNQVNPPDEPQFQGVVFDDGSCVIRWLTASASTSVWASLDDMLLIHGHPEYGSELVWDESRQQWGEPTVVDNPNAVLLADLPAFKPGRPSASVRGHGWPVRSVEEGWVEGFRQNWRESDPLYPEVCGIRNEEHKSVCILPLGHSQNHGWVWP